MKREELFAAAQAAEFTRTKACCPGVELKICSNDEWKGDLGALATQIEQRAIQRCIDFIRNGTFLTDDSPAKRFATEVTAEMEKQLLPAGVRMLTDVDEAAKLFATPQNLQMLAKGVLKGEAHEG